MNLKERALYIASLTLFAITICAHLYESRSTGLLPVVTYPFRIYSIPIALSGLVLLVLALIIQKFSEVKNKTSANDTNPWTFILAFSIAGFVMKIVGEAVHELLGHGFFVFLFGGHVTNIYISPLWPYEFSYVKWSIPSASPDQMTWIMGGGILVSVTVSYSIQILLLWKQIQM